jgi:hypothetical protein
MEGRQRCARARGGGGGGRLISGSRLLRDEGNDGNSSCGTTTGLGRCAWQGEAGDGPAGTRRAVDRRRGARHVAGQDVTQARSTDRQAWARLGLRVRRRCGAARVGALERVTSRSGVDSLLFNNV